LSALMNPARLRCCQKAGEQPGMQTTSASIAP
jgi:hypothetical protein